MLKILLLALIGTVAYASADYTGVGLGSTESQAEERAFTDAVTRMAISKHPELVEITSYSDEGLKNSESSRSILVHTERLDLSKIKEVSSRTEKTSDGFKVTKTISGITKVQKAEESTDKTEPFRYSKTLGKPKVRIGMSKQELLIKFGEPTDVKQNMFGEKVIFFGGKFCQFIACLVVLENDQVVRYRDFKPVYTEDLK